MRSMEDMNGYREVIHPTSWSSCGKKTYKKRSSSNSKQKQTIAKIISYTLYYDIGWVDGWMDGVFYGCEQDSSSSLNWKSSPCKLSSSS